MTGRAPQVRAGTRLPSMSSGKRAWFVLESSRLHLGTGARNNILTSLGPGHRLPSPSWWPSCHRVPHPDVGSGAAGPTRSSLSSVRHGLSFSPLLPPLTPSLSAAVTLTLRPTPSSELLPPTSGPLPTFLSLSTLSRSLPFPRPGSFPPSDLFSDLTRSLPVDVTVTGPCAVGRSCHFLPCFSRLNTVSNDVFM